MKWAEPSKQLPVILAGLQTASVVVPDETLRHKVWRVLSMAKPVNIACPCNRLKNGLARLKAGITAYEALMTSLC